MTVLSDLRADRRDLCAIAVMGKAPRPGTAKTRLASSIGEQAGAGLAAAFLRDTTENVVIASRAAPIRGFVAYSPAGSEALLTPLIAPGTTLLLADGRSTRAAGVVGFGRCLLETIQHLLDDEGFGAACVLNADGPTLPTRHLVRAAELLARPGDRAVLGAAQDGGYYLLGLKRPHAQLFSDIAWSTATVAADTYARAASIGLDIASLPAWFDVDDRASLDQLCQSLGSGCDGGYEAPVTREALLRLGLLEAVPCIV